MGITLTLGVLAQRLKQSPIMGYLLAGTTVGSILFNHDAVFGVAGLGVVLLLFPPWLEEQGKYDEARMFMFIDAIDYTLK